MLRKVTKLSVVTLLGALFSAAPALAETGLAPSPAQVEFGQVDIHFGGSPQLSVQLTNSSGMPLPVTSVGLTDTAAPSFRIVNDGCSGETLVSPGEPGPDDCTVEVSFTPGATGAKSASLEIFSNDGTLEVPLSGEGITGTLAANPSPLSFSPIPYTGSGSHEEGGQNETAQTTISDSANAGAQVEAVSITGPDASSFSVQYGNCERNLMAPNNTCDEGIRFQPVSPGPKHAQLVITSDSSGSPLTIPLEGEGLLGPKISLSSKQALLGDVLLGSSTWQTFTLTNSGDYPLGVQQAFLVSGTPLMFPVLSDTCSGQIIYPSDSCAVTVGFQPTTPGEKDASILFITSTSLPLNVVGIDGVGVQPTITPQAISPGPPLSMMQASKPAPVSGHASVARPRWLTLQRSAQVQGASGEEALETGVTAQCPADRRLCEAESFITASIPAHSSGSGSKRTPRTTVLLGATTIRLQGGASARVHIPLLGRAITLLRDHGRLRATIGFVIRADGTTVAARTRVVTLVHPG